MGIFNRLETVIASYLNDIPASKKRAAHYEFENENDAFIKQAFEELNDFLERKTASAARTEAGTSAFDDDGARSSIPKSLWPDFEELEVPVGADIEHCKQAYRQLLKQYHPDTCACGAETAAQKTARITDAYRRIKNWYAHTEAG